MSSAPGPGDYPEPPLEPEPQLQVAVGAGIDGHGQATSEDILEARCNQRSEAKKENKETGNLRQLVAGNVEALAGK